MFGLSNLALYGIGLVGVISLAAGIWFHGENYGDHRGYSRAVSEVNAANNRAVEAARLAREALLRECRDNPAICLSDKFTRDSPDRVPPVQPNPQQRP